MRVLRLVRSLSRSFILFVHSSILQSSYHLFIHSFIHSFSQSPKHSFTHPFTHSVTQHSLIHPNIHPFTQTFNHSPIQSPKIQSFTQSATYSPRHSPNQSASAQIIIFCSSQWPLCSPTLTEIRQSVCGHGGSARFAIRCCIVVLVVVDILWLFR